MKIAESREITLRTMTPVFCGSGETLDPLCYVVDGDIIRVIDTDRLLEGLTSRESEQFQSWLIPLLDKRSAIDSQVREARNRRDFQRSGRLSQQRRDLEYELSLNHFVAKKLGKPPGNFLAPFEMYSFRAHSIPDASGFRTHIKDAQHRAYIPGSEIKGAIRTALLYAQLCEQQGYEEYKRLLRDVRGSEYERSRSMRRMADRLETEMLRGEVKGKKQRDAKYDSLRLVQISDSTPVPPEELRLELTQSLGTNRYTRTWIETIQLDEEVKVHLTLGGPELISKTLGLGSITQKLTFAGLFQACYQRARDLILEEAEYFKGQEKISSIIEELKDVNTPVSPLIRLGGGQGFLSVTTNLIVKKKDMELYEESIRKNISSLRRWRTNPNSFPKTRRVISEASDESIDCLGWVKVSL